MEKLFTMLMFAAAATGTVFTSCSKDDDPQAPEPEKPKYELATGKSWVLSQVKQGDGDYVEGSGNMLTFKSDGTFESTDPFFNMFEAGIKYTYDKENTITIKGKHKDRDDGREVMITITIVSLTADAFEIQVKIKGHDPMDANYEQNVSYKGGMR